MFWTIPIFLAVWSVVGADLYVQGAFEDQQMTTDVAAVEVVDGPEVAKLESAEQDN